MFTISTGGEDALIAVMICLIAILMVVILWVANGWRLEIDSRLKSVWRNLTS